MSIATPPVPTGDDIAIKLVDLCAQQIIAAMDEEREEIAGLTGHILSAHKLACNSEEQAEQKDILQQMNQAIGKLQFADRLSQRLLNIANNLSLLKEGLLDYQGENQPDNWKGLLEQVRDSFSMETERQLFDTVLSIDTAPEEESLTKKSPPKLF